MTCVASRKWWQWLIYKLNSCGLISFVINFGWKHNGQDVYWGLSGDLCASILFIWKPYHCLMFSFNFDSYGMSFFLKIYLFFLISGKCFWTNTTIQETYLRCRKHFCGPWVDDLCSRLICDTFIAVCILMRTYLLC